MHTDERVDLKNEFINYIINKGWNDYLSYNKKLTLRVNFLFKLFYISIVVSLFAFGAASMKGYISRDWLWLSFALVIIWLVVERIDMSKIDNIFLKKKREKIVLTFISDEKFLDFIKLFEKLDILPPGFNESFNKDMEEKNYPEIIEKIKKIFYFLDSIKTFEEMNSNLFTNEKERFFEPLD